MTHDDALEACVQALRAAGNGPTAIGMFERHFRILREGGITTIAESDIVAIPGLSDLRHLPPATWETTPWVGKTAVVKLNGGLGTSMGLDQPKSLLPAKEGHTFLDLILQQMDALRDRVGMVPAFYLLNSFNTSEATRQYLRARPGYEWPSAWEWVQNRVPKVDARTWFPVQWPAQPELEWCPPGHADLYAVLWDTGMLDQLIERGIEILFVSNADNLGATLDPQILAHFAESDLDFLMEAAVRTPADRKGGHLCRNQADGRLRLRESAQCSAADADAFQNIQRHRFFNTNNLWIRLSGLRATLARYKGVLPLPPIGNTKTVDPRDKSSTPVIQIEAAMGSAIECFDKAGALTVPRDRFAPVKTTSDLLVLWSDAYALQPDGRVMMHPCCDGRVPTVVLDPNHYKTVDQLRALCRGAEPSLIACDRLDVTGPFALEPGTRFAGNVRLENLAASRHTLPAGHYANRVVVAS